MDRIMDVLCLVYAYDGSGGSDHGCALLSLRLRW